MIEDSARALPEYVALALTRLVPTMQAWATGGTIAETGTIGNPVFADDSREYAVKNVALIKFPKGCLVDNRFRKDILNSATMQDQFQRQASGSTQKFIPLGFIRKLKIPLPPLATQRAIVAEIEAEQALVAANRELITRFEMKIQSSIARIWGAEPGVSEKDT